MRRIGHLILCCTGVLAFCFVGAASSVAAPDAHAAAPAAAPAESSHSSAAPAPAAEPTHAAEPAPQPAASPRPSGAPANSSASTIQGGVNQVQQNIINRSNAQANQQAANGGRNNGYYPLGYASAFWDPNWTPYGDSNNYPNNYNGNGYSPAYPAQFTQPAENDQTEPPSVNSQAIPTGTAQTVAPAPTGPDVTSAALKSALLASPQWRDADEQVRIDQSQYDSASAIVLAKLRAQPAYQQALAQKAADAQKIASIKAKDPNAPIDRTEAVATAKLDAAQSVTQMENAAIAADPRASAAKVKLDTAIAQRQEIRQAIESAAPRPVPAQQ